MENTNSEKNVAIIGGGNGMSAANLMKEVMKAAAAAPIEVDETGTPKNVMYYDEKTSIKAFTPEGDELAGMSRNDLLKGLGKESAGIEAVTGTVVEDGVTGERMMVSRKDMSAEEKVAESLQELQPEELKRHLSTMVVESLKALVGPAVTDFDFDEYVKTLEETIAPLDRKAIRNMTIAEVKMLMGQQISKIATASHGTEAGKLMRKLLLDFKDGIVEYTGMIDTMDEINRHMKFFDDINIEDTRKTIESEVDGSGELFNTELHKYRRKLELYVERLLADNAENKDNRFLMEEIKLAQTKIQALNDALGFTQLLHKCHAGKSKLIKDFKNGVLMSKAITDFLGKLQADDTVTIPFPLPRKWNPKMNEAQMLATVMISFIEMALLRGQFPAIKELTSIDHFEMVQTLKGVDVKKDQRAELVETVNVVNIPEFIEQVGITYADVAKANAGAIALTYIIARTFKPSVLDKDIQQKYVLSYTMNIISQAMHNDECNALLQKLLADVEAALD